MRKRKDAALEPDPNLYLWLMDPDADQGGPKHIDPDPEHWFFSLHRFTGGLFELTTYVVVITVY